MTETLIKVEGVSKKFCRSLKRSLWYGLQDLGSELIGRRHGGGGMLRKDEFWAVKDVSFELKRGECLGLIGSNGAGKTTLLKVLTGLLKPDEGRVEMRGRIGALIALGAGFNPILSGRENIYVNAAVLGLTKAEIDARVDEIIEFAEIGDFIDSPVQNYSSGMQVRLGFAVATTLDPDVLILDEVLAVGDTAFRGKCFQRIGKLLNNAAVIFVSHNETQVARICSSTLLLKSGRPLHFGDTAEGLRRYRTTLEARTSELQILKDPRVISIRSVAPSDVVAWGGKIELQFEIRASEALVAGFLLLHWSRHGEFVANSEIRYADRGGLPIAAGTHILTVVVGPVHLIYGKYDFTLSIFDHTMQQTIVHAFNISSVAVLGPVGSGPTTLLPIEARLSTAEPLETPAPEKVNDPI